MKNIFLSGISLLFIGCHSTKKTTQLAENQLVTTKYSIEILTKKVAENTLQSSRFSAHADLQINTPEQNLDATANIFWVRDSVLWVQVKKFGFEGARALVRRDSVFLINRLEQTYVAESLDFLRKKFQLPADFSVINAFVTGEIWLLPNAEIDVRLENGQSKIVAKSRTTTLFEDILFRNTPILPEKMMFRDQSSGQTATSVFEKWGKIEGKMGYFSFLRHVEMDSPATGKTQVEISWSDLDLSPKKGFKFEIPAHYKRVLMNN